MLHPARGFNAQAAFGQAGILVDACTREHAALAAYAFISIKNFKSHFYVSLLTAFICTASALKYQFRMPIRSFIFFI
jgi:hypothetical protein